jgi:hypothetical protein
LELSGPLDDNDSDSDSAYESDYIHPPQRRPNQYDATSRAQLVAN